MIKRTATIGELAGDSVIHWVLIGVLPLRLLAPVPCPAFCLALSLFFVAGVGLLDGFFLSFARASGSEGERPRRGTAYACWSDAMACIVCVFAGVG